MQTEETHEPVEVIDEVQALAPNAIAHIRDSSIFSDSKNEWVSPLIEKVLVDEEVSDREIRSALLESEIDDESMTRTTSQIQLGAAYVVSRPDVRRINEITSITNVGLLDITEPLSLEDGLNIFYGKNGAGKSSIYLGLCKILGKEKTLYPDVENLDEKSSCAIKYQNQADIEEKLSWETEADVRESSVMIFDGEIAQTLVEDDQDNAFEIAHLQVEYFTYLRELYERIESIIAERIRTRGQSIIETEETLADDIPSLAETSDKELEETVGHTFTAEERANLTEYLRQKEILSKGTPEAELKNLGTAKNAVRSVLGRFGEMSEDHEWMFLYEHTRLVELNKRIRNLNVIQKAFEESGVQKVAGIIPADWISNQTWTTFIEGGLAFVESLDDESKRKYSEETCIYCQQSLATSESKKLISAYAEMGSEIEAKLRDERRYLQEQGRVVDSCIAAMQMIAETNATIEAEFPAIARTDKISLNKDVLLVTFGKIKSGITDMADVTLSEEEQDGLLAFYNEYKALLASLEKAEKELALPIANKKDSIAKLDKDIAPLQEKSHIDKHRKVLSSYLANRKAKVGLEAKLSDIYALKAARSRLESDFARVAGLHEFQEQLKKEYAALRFSPPQYWKLSTITPGGVNKRAYRLNDRRLAEIFSEGERKLHSLADFFAQCEVNKYKGVYIFDDPVNSLDEENIELVAARIVALADAGNQVIVFTHNLFFLNELVDASGKKITEVTKDGGQIAIETSVSKDDKAELKKTLKKIEERMKSLSEKDSVDDDDVAFVYNYISQYLEYYVEQILFKNVVHRHRSHIRMSGLDKLVLNEEVVKNVDRIYRKTNRKSIRHAKTDGTRAPTYDELKEDVTYIKEHLGYA